MPVTWGAKGTLPTASHFVIILARRQKSMKYDSSYITHMMYEVHHLPPESAEGRRQKYREFQEDDFKLLESERATFDWASRQCYIALGNMMTTAAMLGVDSCPIEGFKADEMEKMLSEELGVDTTLFGVAVMVAFGYRVDEPATKTRQKTDAMTTWYN